MRPSVTACDTARGPCVGITNHLDYIQGLGFNTLWISPIVENFDGTAYGDGYHG
ncbi:hypothetical protein B0H13DRAFT_2072442 [Mycena leptocephala]|nr:hypothetical protein B0H13DRAFT_2072442 [Mycena leptocephala]